MDIQALPTEKDWVGQCVRYWRVLHKLQQADIAAAMTEHLGVRWSQGVVANIEAGRRAVSLYELLALCLVFDVQLRDLLYPPRPARPGMPDREPGVIQTPDGQRCAYTWHLLEAFGQELSHEGLDLEATHSPFAPNVVNPNDVRDARGRYLTDPELQALQTITFVADLDQLSNYVDAAYRGTYRGRRHKPYTATDLVDATEKAMRAEQPTKSYETEHAQRTLRHHARARAKDLVLQEVMRQL